MDFRFEEDQIELAALARRIFGDRVTPDSLKEVEQGTDRFDRRLWGELGRAGLIGIGLPEDCGGGGGGLIDHCIVLEEAGRVLAPVPLLATVSAIGPIGRFGTPAQKQMLAAVLAGEAVATAALMEPLSADPDPVGTVAVADGDGWILSGIKTAVPSAPVADLLVVSARAGEESVAFLVRPDQTGVRISRQKTSDRDDAGLVELESVRVTDDMVLGQGEDRAQVARWMAERATIALCALQLGVVEAAVASTAKYTTERMAFGRPIATFQAVGHRAADAYIDAEGLRLTTWQAAWRLSQELPASLEVEVAKFWAAEAGHRVAHAAVHLHGGMGVAVEYPLHRYFLWAKQLEFSLGGASQQLVRMGALLAAEGV